MRPSHVRVVVLLCARPRRPLSRMAALVESSAPLVAVVHVERMAVVVVRIMGIDPSLTGCGLVMIIDGELKITEVFGTPASDPRGKRLGDIAQAVASFYKRYGPPDVVAMEDYAFGSPYNRESMGEVGGIIKAALWRITQDRVGTEGTYAVHIEPVLWPNHSWKKAVLGKGGIKKEDLKLPVFQKYGVEISDMNALEAFCVAMAEHLAQANPTLRPVPKPKKGAKKK